MESALRIDFWLEVTASNKKIDEIDFILSLDVFHSVISFETISSIQNSCFYSTFIKNIS